MYFYLMSNKDHYNYYYCYLCQSKFSTERIRKNWDLKLYECTANFYVFLFLARGRVDCSIYLHSILKFVTGCENEPVLGFQMKPSICFDTNMPSCLPIGNTCISRLTSPLGENVSRTKEEVFSFFDYAFANDYFGLV